jgi:hypothetical protein
MIFFKLIFLIFLLVVRSERSHSVTRPASLVPSSPSGGSSGQQPSTLLQALQPPTPVFHQPTHHDNSQSSSQAAVRRLSEAVASSASSSSMTRDESMNEEKMHRMSLTLPTTSVSSVRISTPDLPSSPDDEQSE